MYNHYFGLTEPPFSIAPDPRFLYMSEQHREALAHLLYGINSNGGFVLLTGEVGTGKTTVTRCLLEQLPENTEVAFILNPKYTVNELLATICDDLGITIAADSDSLKEYVDRINHHLIENHRQNKNTVLIIDEAQNLSVDVLETIRLLTNLETNTQKLLQIILVGQPELLELLSQPSLRQLNQRITARYHLRTLNQYEIQAYISHRLAVAGVDCPLFNDAALKRLYKLTKGVPRLINIICDRALLGAYVQRQTMVKTEVLGKAAGEVLGEQQLAQSNGGGRFVPLYAALIIVLVIAVLALVYPGYQVLINSAQALVSVESNDNHAVAAVESAPSSLQAASEQSLEEPKIETAVATSKTETAQMAEQIPMVEPAGSDEVIATVEQSRQQQPAVLEHQNLPPTSLPDSSQPTGAQAVILEQQSEPVPVEQTQPVETAVAVITQTQQAVPAEPAGDNLITPSSANPVSAPSIPVLSNPANWYWQSSEEAELSETLAYQHLFKLWGEVYDPREQPAVCLAAESRGLNCYFQVSGLDELRRINLPAVVQMQNAQGQRFYAAISTINADIAKLYVAEKIRYVELHDLELWLSGNFTLFWRRPEAISHILAPGESGPEITWLDQQLASIQGRDPRQPPPQSYDSALVWQVKKFQTASGLVPDGVVGPKTLIQLAAGSAADMPRLTKP